MKDTTQNICHCRKGYNMQVVSLEHAGRNRSLQCSYSTFSCTRRYEIYQEGSLPVLAYTHMSLLLSSCMYRKNKADVCLIEMSVQISLFCTAASVYQSFRTLMLLCDVDNELPLERTRHSSLLTQDTCFSVLLYCKDSPVSFNDLLLALAVFCFILYFYSCLV